MRLGEMHRVLQNFLGRGTQHLLLHGRPIVIVEKIPMNLSCVLVPLLAQGFQRVLALIIIVHSIVLAVAPQMSKIFELALFTAIVHRLALPALE